MIHNEQSRKNRVVFSLHNGRDTRQTFREMATNYGFAWGSEETRHFFELTPDRILDAVEELGVRCTGRCMALNSMENRVFEVEVELDHTPRSPVDAFRVAKFYRPGRWSREQIQEEHDFLLDLRADDIPAVAPLPFPDGSTLSQVENEGIWYAVFPKVGGRNPDELSDEQFEMVGRLLARIHNAGGRRKTKGRIEIGPVNYGQKSLDFLLEEEVITAEYEESYCQIVEEICDMAEPLFERCDKQRVHGDAHLGNLLYGDDGFFWVDFDDMVHGPCVQDVWLLTPGRDDESRRNRDTLLGAYDMMRQFDYTSLELVEPLRALRYIHFSAWIAKRWRDASFPQKFPDFGKPAYWREQLGDLEECLEWMRRRESF